MPDHGLLFLAPIRPGFEDNLRRALNAFGNDIRGDRSDAEAPRVNFTDSPTIHFARFALMDDPQRGEGRKRLLFATDFDGDEAAHASEVYARTRHPDRIWGACEGFEDAESFPAFLRRHAVEPGAYYIAFRGDSLAQCRRALGLRAWMDQRLSEPGNGELLRAYPDLRDLRAWSLRIYDALRSPILWAWGVLMTAVEVIGLMRKHGIAGVIEASKSINATLNRVGWIRVLNALLRNKPTPPPHRYTEASRVAPRLSRSGEPPEDAILQNQLTLVTSVQPGALPKLRTVLALIDLYGRRLSPRGSLVGISTIHTVRWALIDEGRSLLMVSNYDGTWENYIDEFAEMILSGLDALWASSPEYPKAGAQDVAALKQFLRRHQVPANAFYGAYPEVSVLNLVDAMSFERESGAILARLVGKGATPVPETPDAGMTSGRGSGGWVAP